MQPISKGQTSDWATWVLAVAAMVLVVASPATRAVEKAASASAYVDDIRSWQADRERRLRRPDGYLALTGLFWLADGQSTFGADPANDIVFPSAEAPARMGVFHLDKGTIRVEIASGVDVRHDGEPVRSMRLYHDADADHDRTELTHGTMTWYAIQRGDKYGIRLRDTDSEVLRGFAGVERFPIDRKWRIEGTFERYAPPRHLAITSVGDIHTNERCPGAVVFKIAGEVYKLDALADPGDESLFVIFADETSGLETYGGGRFVYVDMPAEDGRIVIDFNKAYNPPCAFSAFTTCPLPPRQNRLPLRVTAGEKAAPTHQF